MSPTCIPGCQAVPMPTALLLVALASVFLVAGRAGADDPRAGTVSSPPVTGGNDFYVSNRSPLLPSPLIKLPIGSIRPEGWLRGQLELEADGMTGHLPELSQWCRAERSAWMSPDGEGSFGWEELPYWLKGFGDLGYVLGDERIVAEARTWIEAVLASQEEDGYFGPRANKANNDLWPNMIMLNVLESFYEAIGDERVLPFLTNYYRWEISIPEDQLLPGSWQKIRAGDNLQSVYWLYNRTGEAWLLGLADRIHRHTADWTGGIASWHGVNICQSHREPGQYYQQSGDRRFLDAAERNYQTVMSMYGQVPGGLFGADENCRPGYTGPRQAAETCSIVELMLSNEILLKITGDPKYADRCEEIALNSLPASMPPDLRGLHYLTAPNMVQLDRHNKSPMLQNGGNMLAYDPRSYRCCQHNVSHGWPYYAEHLWLATQGNGLAAVLYAACEVTARVGDGTTVTIQERTDYPFGETVRLRISMPKPVVFPLMLRIPQWCEDGKVEVNGRPVSVTARPLSYVVLERAWQDGDQVTLHLPMTVRVRRWDHNHKAASVDHGPLTYSLRIEERWERYGGTDDWPAFEVFPASPWNYALVLEDLDPTASFRVVRSERPLARQPFTVADAPVLLVATGRRIPQWKQEYNGLVAEIQDSPVKTDAPIEEIILIPMGCARLRISAFPVAGEGPDAHLWTEPLPAPATASHCNPGDTVEALSDGREPRNSNDHSIPRFTWWDHRGTAEWVAYNFHEPRRVSWVEVYWFDDTGVGMCRVPASWRLSYRDGDEWKPVVGAQEYGVAADSYNRVSFEPVVTRGLRIEVQLREGFSGGILEWRVGE